MISPLAMIFAALLVWESIALLDAATAALMAIADARVDVMSSGLPCPAVTSTGGCHLQVEARESGQWAVCDELHPPSGADLPMERWFRVTGKCPVQGSVLRLALTLPPIEVFR